MEPDFWGIFHDGEIIGVVGVVPGTISLRILIPYLRNMFPGEGDCFVVTLEACAAIHYQPFDGPATTILDEITQARPEILYLQDTPSPCLDCAGGTLGMEYHSATVALDTGEPVSYAALVQACDDYWNAWAHKGDAPSSPEQEKQDT